MKRMQTDLGSNLDSNLYFGRGSRESKISISLSKIIKNIRISRILSFKCSLWILFFIISLFIFFFSLRLGSELVVVLNGTVSIKEAFGKWEFLGRPPSSAFSLLANKSKLSERINFIKIIIFQINILSYIQSQRLLALKFCMCFSAVFKHMLSGRRPRAPNFQGPLKSLEVEVC